MKNERNLKTSSSLKKLKKQVKLNAAEDSKSRSRVNAGKYIKIVSLTAGILALLILFGAVTISLLNDAGVIMRLRKKDKSEDLSINGAMMTYLFWDTYLSYTTGEYATFYKMQGVYSPEDLMNDNPNEEGKTWWDHFEKITVDTAAAMLNYAQYAINGGAGLKDEDYKLIEEELESLENSAYVMGQDIDEYLADNYGRGVKLSDVRDVFELICLSNNGMVLAGKEMVPSEEQINEFYKTNTNELKKADYYYFVLGISGKDNLTPEQEKYYSEKAEEIKNSKSEEEFKKKVEAYIKEQNDNLSENDPLKLDDLALKEAIASELKSLDMTGSLYTDNLSVDKWLYSDERAYGDTYIHHQEGFGTYGVMFMIKPTYIAEDWKDIAKDKLSDKMLEELLLTLDKDYPIDLSGLGNAIANLA